MVVRCLWSCSCPLSCTDVGLGRGGLGCAGGPVSWASPLSCCIDVVYGGGGGVVLVVLCVMLMSIFLLC